ncbi:MAG: hypothetical protein IJP26_04010 [Clostridia bacterium]|nr:hypothetical protein [Clostridia bacterium]
MLDDSDIKIAGNKPSESIKKLNDVLEKNLTPEEISKAKQLGKILAEKFLHESANFYPTDSEDSQMLLQRKLLLSFTVSVSLDEFCKNDSISGIAEKSFLDRIRDFSQELYVSCSDTGAFSFYYLAFRRGGEIERRMGQTFAMLCSHDGDPIFQELGETLYCWFASVVRQETEKIGLLK